MYTEGVVSQHMAADCNARYPDRHIIMSSKSTTHFMTGGSTLRMFGNGIRHALKR